MAAEQSQNELTTTLHLGLREVTHSPAQHLEEQLALLSPEDRSVIAEIQSSKGEKAMILIARGANKGSRFLVTADGATIGRSPSSAIFLDDVTVSRSHAVVEHSVSSNYLVKDVGSLNGTYVDGVVTNEKVLSNGSELHIGKYKLVFFINDKNLFAKP